MSFKRYTKVEQVQPVVLDAQTEADRIARDPASLASKERNRIPVPVEKRSH